MAEGRCIAKREVEVHTRAVSSLGWLGREWEWERGRKPRSTGGGGQWAQITGASVVMLGVGTHPQSSREPCEGFHQGSGQTT